MMRDGGIDSSAKAASTSAAYTAMSAPPNNVADPVRAHPKHAQRQLVLRAAERYRQAGRAAYYFARGKLGGDPVFAALLRDGRVNDAARVVDVGCGLGLLAAWLANAEVCDPRSASEWPQTWALPPKNWTLHGFDLRTQAVTAGQCALSDLGHRVSLSVGDARDTSLPACDVVVMLDVLHYMDRDAQQALLKSAHQVLAPGGTVLLRVADITSNWRSRYTLMVDWWVTILRDRRWPRLHCRSLAQWTLLLESIGYAVVAQPMSEGTLFANVLLIATKSPLGKMTAASHSIGLTSAERKRRARERLITLTRLMDSAVDVPLLRTKVGLDALLGVVPVAGDLLSAAIGVYLVAQARELGASRWLQGKMIGNLVVDAAFGAVPLAGDVFDIYFRAHRRNLKLLQQHLGEPYLDVRGVDFGYRRRREAR